MAVTVQAIADVVSQGIDDVSGVIQAFYEGIAGDPCQGVIAVSQELLTRENDLVDYEGWAAEGAAAIQLAIDRTLGTWGEDNRANGAPSFATYLWQNGAAPPNETTITAAAVLQALFTLGIGGAIFGGAAEQNWRNRLLSAMPAPGNAPSNRNRGYQLGPGIFLYHPNSRYLPGAGGDAVNLVHGRLTGTEAKRLYWAWRRLVLDSVGPTEWPRWATDQAYLTGSAHWQPGDPMRGAIAQFRDQVGLVREFLSSQEAACDLQRQNIEDNIDDAIDLERERRRLLAMAAVAVAWILKGRKK